MNPQANNDRATEEVASLKSVVQFKPEAELTAPVS